MGSTPLACILFLSCSLWSVAAAEASSAPASTNALPFARLTQSTNDQEVIVENLTGEGEVEYDFENRLTFFRNGVVVRYGAIELVANQVALSEITGDIIADGNVRMRNEGQYWVGQHLEYNYKTGQITTDSFRAGFPPLYVHGLRLEANTQEQEYIARESYITSDDIKDPNFRIRARQFRVRVGKSVDARGAKLYLGNTPVFYLPYFHRDLTQHRTFWRVTPGYRSRWGAHLLSAYHFPITTNLSAVANIDLYQKRGIGVGPDLLWEYQRWGEGDFRYYYINDEDPEEDEAGNPIGEDRHRVSFSHRVNLRTNLTAKVVVREQSDLFFIRDFFETEYRKNTQPKTFLEINQLWSNWSLDLMAQAQVNDFFETVERLPDLKLSGIRQQIGATPLFYESETSLAYLRFQSGLPNGTNYAAMRADSFHQILWPQTYFGWLNFVPRVGGRYTQYGETDTEGPAVEFDERGRFVFNTGAELSVKASRVWRGAQSKFWEVNELRHILQPSVNYVFVPEPNLTPNELPQFDREIPSLRLLPIDFPDYNAIDSIDSQNVLRFGLRNRLQTKREEGIQNLVNWALYTDWRLDPRDGQSTFADFYSDLDLRPRSWLTLNSETRYNVHSKEWNAAYHTLTIAPNSTWSTKLGHRYFRGGPEFGPDSDNNTIFGSFYYKFNENWAMRISEHFEARDGVLEEQYYTLYRDFRSWTGALTVRFRNPRERSNEFAIAFTFQLKAFPRFLLGEDRDAPDFLLGS